MREYSIVGDYSRGLQLPRSGLHEPVDFLTVNIRLKGHPLTDTDTEQFYPVMTDALNWMVEKSGNPAD